MVDVDDDDDDLGMGPVIVRRPVHDAAEQLRRETSQVYGAALEAAAERERRGAAAGDAAQVTFWHDVSNFLQWQAAVAAHVETIILEEGETWDREAGCVIRPDGRLRRNDTES